MQAELRDEELKRQPVRESPAMRKTMEHSPMILDSIIPVEVSDVGSLTNELNALRRLADGMSYLYGQVRTWELHISEAIPKNVRVFSFGNDPRMRGVPRDRIECHFHWYAVSLLNFVRLVSYIASGGNRRRRLRYEKPVLGAVLNFRHKIGAHIAVAKQLDNLVGQPGSRLSNQRLDN